MLDPFEQRRQQVLSQLSSVELDKSRAGGVDARIKGFMAGMNKHADLYTTSSCSGRISILAEPSADTRAAGMKGGAWVYATHDLADYQDILNSIHKSLAIGSKLIFRFEPFILAVECRDMTTAQQLVAVAREAGFRESGVTATKARTIAGIRCSLRLEVPLADQGQMLVSQQYLQKYLVDFSNEKMQANWDRTHRFAALFTQKMLASPELQECKAASKKGNRRLNLKQPQTRPGASSFLLSSYATKQLLAQGVPQRVLNQIQAGTAAFDKQQQQQQQRSSCQTDEHSSGKQQAHPAKSCTGNQKNLSDVAANLQAKQDRLFTRIMALEQAAATTTSNRSHASRSEAIRWQALTVDYRGVYGSILQRWGHTTTAVGSKLVIFGGYGGSGAHSRTADLLVYECESQQLTGCPAAGVQPPPRMSHTAVLIGTTLIVFGGRDSPSRPLNDLWALDTIRWHWQRIECKGERPQPRFRHSAVSIGSSLKDGVIFVHGGYTGTDILGDTWVLHTADWSWHQYQSAGPSPRACHSHAAAILGHHMYIHGGTSNYTHTFADLHALDLNTATWWCLTAAETPGNGQSIAAPACFSHTMTAAGDLLIVAGGCHTQGAGHVHTYRPSSNQWSKHNVSNGGRLVLCRHTATVMDDQLYCLGGGMNCFGFGTTFSVPMQLDLSPLLQQCERSFSQSHMLSHLNKSNAQMGKSNPPLGKFTSQGEKSTPPRQQAALLSDCSVGKHKVQVVSTGTASFSESSLHPLTVFRNTDNALDLSSQPEASTQGVSTAGVPTAVEDAPTFPSQPTASGDSHAGQIRMAFAICKAQAKSAKDSLRAVGWLDRSCKAHADALGNICLPITEVGSQQLASYQPYAPCGPDSQTNVPLQNGHAPTAQLSASSQQSSYVSVSDQHPSTAQSHTQPDVLNTNGMYIESTTCAQPHPREQRCVNGNTKHVQGSPGQQHMRCLKHMLANGSAKLQPLDAVIPARAGVGPAAKLRQQIQELLEQQAVSQQHTAALLAELPVRWEKLGDLALLPNNCMISSSWPSLVADVWQVVCHALGVQRLARQAHVANTGTRDSQAELLLGNSGWVQHKEGGVLYSLDITKCMFSSGNTTVRQRMGQLNCAGETVLDLYAGIGYYTLPFLVKAGAARAIACEWNPHAVHALHKNLCLNGVADRCEVLQGDNRLTAPKEVADRVSLGLLPSSEGSWPTALAALKPSGGWLHLHQNVTDFQEQEWCQATIVRLQSLAEQQGRLWHFRLCKVDRVKWYAPHIRHVVLDIQVLPHTEILCSKDDQRC